jgi:hypothetical protein
MTQEDRDTDTSPSDPTSVDADEVSPDRLPLFRELDTRGQLKRSIIIVFTAIHLGALLVGGAIPSVRNAFRPILGFYSDGLRMSNSWGMFGKPPNATHIVVEAVMRDGKTHVLSTTNARDRTTYERIRDVRIRKIQSKLAELADRTRFGGAYLDYFCRLAIATYGNAVRDVRARNEVHELRDDQNKVTRQPSSNIVLSRRCSDPKSVPPWRPKVPLVAPKLPAGDGLNEGGDL